MQRETGNSRSPRVMAIVNVTPDSFYAASRSLDLSEVAHRIERVVAEGASIIDIGGISTRPMAEDVSVEEEWARVALALKALGEVGCSDVTLSIDTTRAEIVRRVADEVPSFVVNDISAGESDSDMIPTVARMGLGYVAMHRRGTPKTMQQMTHYRDVVGEVRDYLASRLKVCLANGMEQNRIWLDPGFGFAKSVEQNFRLLASIKDIASLGCEILVGVSRKSMVCSPLGIEPEEALTASQLLHWEALSGGATILRTHDVAATMQCIKLFEEYQSAQ